jgi:TonB family protein
MNEAATDVIVARSRDNDRLSTMVVWSIAAHIVVTALIMFMPAPDTTPPPRTIMTISLGGAPGPRTGGMTQMGSRPVQAPPPEEPVRRAETAPAPTPPAMTLPDPKARTRPETAKPKQAPPDAASKTLTTGEKPNEGTAPSSPQVRGQGFGLSSAGGTGGPVTLDVADFCCPEYINQMVDIVRNNWNQNQRIVGVTGMKFTITRNGTLDAIQIEKSSGFAVLDAAADRALRVTKLPALPRQFPNQTLTVHMEFEYSLR